MVDKGLSSIQKVWQSGTTLVIAIPRRIREILDIHKGDYLQVEWGDIIKRKEEFIKKIKTNGKKIQDKEIEEIEEEIELENEDDVLPHMD